MAALFPQAADLVSHTTHHGRADALLLAAFSSGAVFGVGPHWATLGEARDAVLTAAAFGTSRSDGQDDAIARAAWLALAVGATGMVENAPVCGADEPLTTARVFRTCAPPLGVPRHPERTYDGAGWKAWRSFLAPASGV